MVNAHMRKNLTKRVRRRLGSYKLKLMVIFLVVFSTTAIFLSFFVGTSSVLQSVEDFNQTYHVEDGNLRSLSEVEAVDKIDIEEMKYGEVRENGTTIRIFQERERINKHQVTAGGDLAQNYDLLLDQNYMDANGLNINDGIVLNNEEFNITGAAISPDYITTKNSDLVLQANADVFGIAYVSEETFDAFFEETFTSYYAYISDLNVEEVSDAIDPIYIMDSKNNTRIQQVIGDAEAPRDLALLLTCLLYLIVAVLLSVYHFEVSKKEKNNLATFNKLGFQTSSLFKHYATETTLTLFVAWILGAVVGILSIDTIQQMNSQIYNYPVLETNTGLLVLCLVASLSIILIINYLLVYQFYVKIKKRVSKQKPAKQKLTRPRFILPFVYRYRLKRINRNKKEMVLFVVLIFFVGLLINFSFLLKDSVTQYVEDLSTENTFEEILFLGEDLEEVNGEAFNLYNLYDEEGVTQSVYVIDSDSEFYQYDLDLSDGDVVISQAFSDKYSKYPSDEIILTDITNQEEYQLLITNVNEVTTVSNIYVVDDDRSVFKEKTFSTPAVTLSEPYQSPNDPEIEATLTKSEIISSGENILDVINKQITLILSLAIVLQVALLYSLLEFSYQNSLKSINVFKLEGYSIKELMRMHFAFSIPIAFLCVLAAYLLSREIVRVFLDQIMFDFVNFVKVTDSLFIILTSNAMVLFIFVFFLLRLRTSMNK